MKADFLVSDVDVMIVVAFMCLRRYNIPVVDSGLDTHYQLLTPVCKQLENYTFEKYFRSTHLTDYLASIHVYLCLIEICTTLKSQKM